MAHDPEARGGFGVARRRANKGRAEHEEQSQLVGANSLRASTASAAAFDDCVQPLPAATHLRPRSLPGPALGHCCVLNSTGPVCALFALGGLGRFP